MKTKFKGYFSGKTRQLKHLSWFFAGFFFASGLNWIAIVALALAVLLDFLWYMLQDYKKTGGA